LRKRNDFYPVMALLIITLDNSTIYLKPNIIDSLETGHLFNDAGYLRQKYGNRIMIQPKPEIGFA